MTTPNFVAQDSSSLAEVRYYTQFDPYYYSVDNRPLQDLASNINTIAGGGGDSARRAALIAQLNLSDLFREKIIVSGKSFASGLAVKLPDPTTLSIGAGALYFADTINSATTTQIIKQAISLAPVEFIVTPPPSTGESIDYLIQAEATTLTSPNMVGSNLPYLDSTNSFLPGLLLNAELKLSMKTGSAGVSGTQSTPEADVNHIPLYIVTYANGDTAPMIRSANEVSFPTSTVSATPKLTNTEAASYTSIAGQEINTLTFLSSATNSAYVEIPLNSALNLFENISVTLKFSTSAVGEVYLDFGYLTNKVGSSGGASFISYGTEAISGSPVDQEILEVEQTLTIPCSSLTQFSPVTKKLEFVSDTLLIKITRLALATQDTCTGDFYLFGVNVGQGASTPIPVSGGSLPT